MPWPYYILVGSYCALIFWVSGQPDPPGPDALFPQMDKLQHIVAFGLIAAMVLTGMIRSKRNHPLRRLMMVPVLFTIAFGLTDEFHQSFVPLRNVDPFDIVADAVGASLAVYVLLRYWQGHSHETLRATLLGPRRAD